jgi:hypothetical protein
LKKVLIIFFGLIFVLYLIGSLDTESTDNNTNYSSPYKKSTTTKPKSDWSAWSSKDEMSGNIAGYASSKKFPSSNTMDFPYSNTKAFLGVGFSSNSEWAYVGFTNAPNLTGSNTKSDYDEIRTRIKFDNQLEYITLTQDWGSKFLHFENDKDIISRLKKANTILLELKWHGEGSVYFKFSLKGYKSTKQSNGFCEIVLG